MTKITYRDGVSIGLIAAYTPCLLVSLLLAARHGFGRSGGWVFLIIFCLIRIIASGFQLATITWPTSQDLYTGVLILENIGISPLLLTTLGLLTRLFTIINAYHRTFFQSIHLRIIGLVVTAGLILGIFGGVNASTSASNNTGGQMTYSNNLIKAGIIVFIASYVIIAAITLLNTPYMRYANGEKRLYTAVLLSLPVLAVRIIYSILAVFANNPKYSPLTGDVTIYLCVALIEEFIVVILYLSVGLTLSRSLPAQAGYAAAPPSAPRGAPAPVYNQNQAYPPPAGQPTRQQRGGGSQNGVVNFVSKYTIFGRLISAGVNRSRSNKDVEMQHGYGSN